MTRRPYKCENCGTFEIRQKVSEDTLSECPFCGGEVRIDYHEWKRDNLSMTQPAFNFIEVNSPEWKRRGRRWTKEHKIKGIDN